MSCWTSGIVLGNRRSVRSKMSENKIIKREKLKISAMKFAKESLSKATRRAYESDWNIFYYWCRDHDVEALPAKSETICLYLTALAEFNISVSTIVRKYTSINAIHRSAGHAAPKNEEIKRVLQGIKNTLGRPAEHARSISWDELRLLLCHTDNLMIGLRDAAILVLGWASALRRSELVALNNSDLDISDKGMLVKIRRSKTDQEGNGKIIAIPRMDKTKNPMNPFCPVEIVEKWIARKNSNNPDNPLFVSIGARGKNAWFWKSDRRLPDRMISNIVKKYAILAGIPAKNISAHSLRRGLATEAASRNVPERIIARHTRHASLVVLRQYIDEGTIWNENPLTSIYQPSSGPISGLS